jgi:GxxExxY protein
LAIEFDDLSHQVIGAAITVHKALGPGFLESVYEEGFCLELAALGIPFERQKVVSILYNGQVIGEHRLDILVAGCLVVELKAVKKLEDIHLATVLSYLKATNCSLGLLLNFASPTLDVRRVVRRPCL